MCNILSRVLGAFVGFVLLNLLLSLLLAGIFYSPGALAESRVWESSVKNDATWLQLARPERDTEFTKFVIDKHTGKIYFVDSHVFALHIDFVLGYLLKQPFTQANVKRFNRNYSTKKPDFVLGYLTHYPKLDLWTFSFWEGDTIEAPEILQASLVLKNTFYFQDLKFRPDSPKQERIAPTVMARGVSVINNNQIYHALPYQAFNTGEAVGNLRIVPKGTPFESLVFKPNDIVILQESYPDISPVAGIITNNFSTPLSHVNLRASAWRIPNAAIKGISAEASMLNGKPVFLRVTEKSYELRAATHSEFKAMEEALMRKKHVELQSPDLAFTTLTPLSEIKGTDALKFGAKTSNLGKMMGADIENLHIPDGFGIPFSYYLAHIRQHGLDTKIESILTSRRFREDPGWRKAALGELRSAIMDAPMDTQTISAITHQ